VGCPISEYNTEDKSGELDPRAMIALARVNYLHSKFNIVSTILYICVPVLNIFKSNGDFLYTLILFAVEPAVGIVIRVVIFHSRREAIVDMGEEVWLEVPFSNGRICTSLIQWRLVDAEVLF
jgi:hypothetical protein